MSVQIPVGLTELLQAYTVEVLRRRPPDLVEFAIQHFTHLRDSRNVKQVKECPVKSIRKGVSFEDNSLDESNEEDDEESDVLCE